MRTSALYSITRRVPAFYSCLLLGEFLISFITMEQNQELRLLDKSMMAAKIDESSKYGPEAWYKVVLNTGTEEVAESSSHSEDELNMSHGRCLTKPAIDPCT